MIFFKTAWCTLAEKFKFIVSWTNNCNKKTHQDLLDSRRLFPNDTFAPFTFPLCKTFNFSATSAAALMRPLKLVGWFDQGLRRGQRREGNRVSEVSGGQAGRKRREPLSCSRGTCTACVKSCGRCQAAGKWMDVCWSPAQCQNKGIWDQKFQATDHRKVFREFKYTLLLPQFLLTMMTLFKPI